MFVVTGNYVAMFARESANEFNIPIQIHQNCIAIKLLQRCISEIMRKCNTIL